MPAGVVRLSTAYPAFAMDAHFERAVGAVGRTWIGIEAQAVLRAKFPVDAVEHFTEFTDCVRKISRAPGRIRDGLERMLSGRVAASLVFHDAHDDRVKEGVSAKSGPPRGLKVRAAGRFSCIGYEHNHTAAARGIAREGLRAQVHRVVKRRPIT